MKFVSAIDSKPVYPSYLQLADFETYLKHEAVKQQKAGEKKKAGDQGSGDKAAKEVSETQTAKGTGKGGAGASAETDHKQELAEFKSQMEQLY